MSVTVRLDANKITEAAFDKWYKSSSSNVVSAISAAAPKQDGALANSVSISRAGPRSARITVGVDYAKHVIHGRGPIRPKSPDGVLTWLDSLTGQRVFSKYAGPVPPNDFIQRGLRSVGINLKEDI